jgi:hypothetical protein
MGEQGYLSRALTGVLCGAVILAGVAACGSSSSSSRTGAAPTATSDPLASLSADQIRDKAVANLKAASSVHVAGTATGSGSAVDLDLWVANDKCTGTITEPGVGSFQLLAVDGTAWIKPDEQFLKSKAGSNPTMLQLMQGKYLKDSSNPFSQLCSPAQMADGMTLSGTLVKEPYTQVAGQRVLPLRFPQDNSVGYVTDTADPLLVRVAKTGSGLINFTDYNVPFTVTPPPATQTIDIPASGL